MTTKVTVDAHAGWDVEVEIVDTYPDQEKAYKEIVPANTVKDYYITSHRRLGSVVELKRE